VSGAPPLLGSTGSTTIVLAALLVLVGVAMVCVAVWLVRATRTDSRSLGPLEVMGDRSWRRRDADARSRTLDAARPAGAPPPAPMLARDPDDPPPMVLADVIEPAASSDEASEDVAAPAVAAVADDAPEAAGVPELAAGDTMEDGTEDAATPDHERVDEPQPAEHS
jgi:hypothetical protein